MNQYLSTLKQIVEFGSWKDSRTGYRCKMLPGMSMRFDLTDGFPAVTTKKLAWNQVKGELIGFLRGYTNASDFRSLGCKIWDANANDPGKEGAPNAWLTNPFRKGEDDLGSIYGDMWRNWPGIKLVKFADLDESTDRYVSTWPTGIEQIRAAASQGYRILSTIELNDDPATQFDQNCGFTVPKHKLPSGHYQVMYRAIDQVMDCVKKILFTPNDRRILFHAWNPAMLDQMALPPCHLLYQFLPNPQTMELNMCLYIRSNDMFLGSPFNIASGALLLSLIAHMTGYKPVWFTYFIGDAHIYENHMEAVMTQLQRTPGQLPTLRIHEDVPVLAPFTQAVVDDSRWFDEIDPDHFELYGYNPQDPIKADMAV